MAEHDHLTAGVEGNVATVTLDRPERLNAYTPDVAAALAERVEALAGREDVRAMVLTGAGERAFCAGMDVTAYLESSDEGDADGEERSVEALVESTRNTHRVVKALRAAAVPVVAAVNGYAVGGGMDIALACDFRIARADAEFGQAYVNVGLVPDAGAYLLPRLVGEARAKELVMTGDRISGAEAVEAGIAREAVDGDADAVREAAREFARRLADGPTVALGVAKGLVNESFDVSLEAALDHALEGERTCHDTRDHREAVEAFVEGREATFEGR